MTTTERLRQLLDERGVEWGNRFAGESQSRYTRYEVDSGMSVTAWEDTLTGKLGLSVEIDYRLTPEQAVEATLGAGTCRRKPHINLTIGDGFLKQSGWDCSECGCGLDLPVIARYCPNCGRKVVE